MHHSLRSDHLPPKTSSHIHSLPQTKHANDSPSLTNSQLPTKLPALPTLLTSPATSPPSPVDIKTIHPEFNPLQKLAASMLDKIESSLVIPMEKNQTLPKPIDPAVQLAGNFAPVHECPVQTDLQVVGQIPPCLRGVYIRNGPNPMFPPVAGHHVFDGDGMIHAVSIGPDNRVSYSSRYTRTNRLVREYELGRSIFPKPVGELHGFSGLARLALFAARAQIGLVVATRGVGVANAGVVFFNGRLLAMSEDDLPYHVKINGQGDLETIGRFTFDGQIDCAVIAHPKVDPSTGDLHTLSYNPHLKYLKFNTCGEKTRDIDITLDQPTMIHDFVITENFVVIPDQQIVFKSFEMLRNGSPVLYDKEKVSRFGVLSKNDLTGSGINWVNVPDCFCLHLWNAWEERTEDGDPVIVVIVSCMNPPETVLSGEPSRIELTEIRLNLRTKESNRKVIVTGMNLEAGQINQSFLGRKTRFAYLAIAGPWPKCYGVAKVNLENGTVKQFNYGQGRFGGEPYFVSDGEGEDKGYVMVIITDEERDESEFVVLDALQMEQVAAVRLPARVPYGFHGTFVSEDQLKGQVSDC